MELYVQIFDWTEKRKLSRFFSIEVNFSFKAVGMRISKRAFQENKGRQIFQKENISYPLIRTRTWAYQGVSNVRFLENLACFVFLKHPFWDSPFCLITNERRLFQLAGAGKGFVLCVLYVWVIAPWVVELYNCVNIEKQVEWMIKWVSFQLNLSFWSWF